MKPFQRPSVDQHPCALTVIAAAVFTVLIHPFSATAGNCDNVTNSILSSMNVACGSGNTVGGTFGGTTETSNNTGLGLANRAATGQSTAVGNYNYATAVNSTAVGTVNHAFGRDSTAVGVSNSVGVHSLNSNDGANSSAFGTNNLISTTSSSDTGGYSTAMGANNTIYATRSTAVGSNNKIGSDYIASRGIYFQNSTALGYQSWIYGSHSVAIGDSAEVGGRDGEPGSGNTNAALFADRAVAIGNWARARVNGTIAIGDSALAGMSDLAGNGGVSYASTNSIAIGTNARVYGTTTTTGYGSVALGAQSESTGNNSVSLGAGSMDSGQSNVVSIGNSSTQRRIIQMAAGVDATDAVNVGQLTVLGTSTAAALGAGTYNASTNSITGVNFVVGSSNYTSVAGAIGALQSFTPNTGYFSATGIGVASAAAADATAMGANALAQGQFSIAAGNGAFATGNNSSALGSGTTASGLGSTAVGYNATASATNASAVGLGAIASGSNSVALGANSSDGGQSNVVSVGNPTGQRRITNVAAGTASTDAVNMNQLDAARNALTAQMSDIGKKAYAGSASVAAVAGIPALAPDKRFNIGIGFGNYLNQTATAIGGHVRLNDTTVIKAAVGIANSATTTSVGLGFSF